MTRVQAIQAGIFAAIGTFVLTTAGIWVFADARAQSTTSRPAPTVVPSAAAPRSAVVAPSDNTNLRETNDVRVYQAVKDAVVNITSSHTVKALVGNPIFQQFPPEMLPPELRPQERQFQLQSLGSGFVIDPSGYVITNEHVVEQGTDIQCVFVDGKKLPAQVIATDNEHDLAVLKVETKEKLHAIALGSSEDLMIGEPVYAIGNPFGYAGTMTRGIVSAVNRTLDFDEGKSYKGLIQTDASINPGNSGGPLLNAYGEVIGVNSAIRADAHGIGFAISVSNMRDLLPAFLTPEALNRARIGFTVEEVRTVTPPATVNAQVFIKTVDPGSNVQAAGLHAGDQLLQIDSKDVHNVVDALVRLANATPGETMKLTVNRGTGNQAKSLAVDVKIEKVVPPPLTAVQETLLNKLGIKAESVTPDLVKKYKLAVPAGVFVDEVAPKSPAATVGMTPGDVLIQLGQYRVQTVDDVANLLQRVKEPQNAFILVIQGNQLKQGIIAIK